MQLIFPNIRQKSLSIQTNGRTVGKLKPFHRLSSLQYFSNTTVLNGICYIIGPSNIPRNFGRWSTLYSSSFLHFSNTWFEWFFLHYIIATSRKKCKNPLSISFENRTALSNFITTKKMLPTSKSGSPNSTFLSSRPGLIRAGSRVSGLLVAMRTLMLPRGSKPSNWLMSSNMVLCTSLSPPAPSSKRAPEETRILYNHSTYSV